MAMTFKDMCDVIVSAKFLCNKDGTLRTSEEVFNYSATGELYMIFEWYQIALVMLEKRAELNTILERMMHAHDVT